MRVPIAEIIVGDRRREDMGDITGLAESIRQFGLLHPVVVDEQKRLVAGGRRLTACKSLGWQEVEVTFLGELSDKQRREIEIEENLQRKDLTEFEKSKNMVELVQVIREQVKEDACAPSAQANKKGETVPGSYRDIETRTGIPQSTIREAEKHVQAVEKHPFLETAPKKAAIKIAKQIDALPEEDRPKTIKIIAKQMDSSPEKEIVNSVAQNKEESEEFQRANRIKERMRKIIERLHIFSQHPAETYFEGMDKVELAFEEAFWWNNLKIIDGAIEWLTGFREEYAKRFGKQEGIRRVK